MVRKLIDISEETKKELSIEAIRLGFDGLKPYIEALLEKKVKDIKAKK